MRKRVTKFLTVVVILSMILPTMILPTTMAAAAVQIGNTGNIECSCLQETERIKEQVKLENKVRILGTDVLVFKGQYQLKNRVSQNENFWEILKNNVPKNTWETLLKDKKAIFLFEVTDEIKKVLIFKCRCCKTVYLLASTFKNSNGSGSGNNGSGSGNNGSGSGNNGSDSDSNGSGSGNDGDGSDTEKPEEPELKKIDTSSWKFENISFVYDGKVHRPVLIGVPEEIQKELNFVWSTNGETNAGNHSATLTVEVPSGYEPIPDMKVDFTIEEAEYDQSKITWDETSFSYNGKGQSPKPEGLPANAEIISSTDAKVNAGQKYYYEMKVKIPNYKEFTVSTEYDIKPAELSPKHQYNKESGEIKTVIEGIVNQEDVNKIINFVNGNEQDSIKITNPGEYQVKTEVILDTSKEDNYTSTENLVIEKNYLAKRSDSLYKITMEQVTDENGIVRINIYLSDVKIPFASDEDALTLSFNVSYDKNSLQYSYDDDGFVAGSDEWFGDYNPDRNPDDESEAEEHDVSMLFYGALPTEKTLVCTLGYKAKENSKDIEISIMNPELSSGMSEHEFSYTTDSETLVVNRSEDYVAPEVIEINWDLQKDATYQGIDDEEAAREALQEYLDGITTDGTISHVSLNTEDVSSKDITDQEHEEGSSIEDASSEDVTEQKDKKEDSEEKTSDEAEEQPSDEEEQK